MIQQWILTLKVDFTKPPDEVNRDLAKVTDVVKRAAKLGLDYSVRTVERESTQCSK